MYIFAKTLGALTPPPHPPGGSDAYAVTDSRAALLCLNIKQRVYSKIMQFFPIYLRFFLFILFPLLIITSHVY